MMKQRKPMSPGAPLARKTELKRSQLKPGASQLKSSGPVKSRKSGRQSAAEKRGRALVGVRADGRCEIGPGNIPAPMALCQVWSTDWHHRQNRSQGGDWSAANGLGLCRPCHAWVTAAPSRSCAYGWSVRSTVAPAAMPVLRRGVWVWLLEDGSVEPLDFQELAEWVA